MKISDNSAQYGDMLINVLDSNLQYFNVAKGPNGRLGTEIPRGAHYDITLSTNPLGELKPTVYEKGKKMYAVVEVKSKYAKNDAKVKLIDTKGVQGMHIELFDSNYTVLFATKDNVTVKTADYLLDGVKSSVFYDVNSGNESSSPVPDEVVIPTNSSVMFVSSADEAWHKSTYPSFFDMLSLFEQNPVNFSKSPVPYDFGTHFVDVEGHWAENTIKYYSSKGILGGYEDKTFRPDTDMNVDEFIKLIVSSGGEKIKNTTKYWAEPYVEKAKKLGLIKVNDFETFDRPITRNEVARIISKLLANESYPDDLEEYTNGILQIHPTVYTNLLRWQHQKRIHLSKQTVECFSDSM